MNAYRKAPKRASWTRFEEEGGDYPPDGYQHPFIAGDLVLLKNSGGAVVRITRMRNDVKNGRPGFDGVLVNPGTAFRISRAGNEIWGYTTEIARKLPHFHGLRSWDEVDKFNKKKPIRRENDYSGMKQKECRTLKDARERARCERLAKKPWHKRLFGL